MLAGYPLWVALVAAIAGLGTWTCLSLWERRVRQEEADTLRLVEEKEAAAAQAAAAAAANAERHRALAEASAIVLWRADAQGRILAAEGWAALTGQPTEAALGDGWTAMLHPEDGPRTMAAWQTALRNVTPVDMEYRLRTADGAWRWCRARAVPIGAGPANRGPAEWVGVLEDVDDRRRAEEHQLLVAREVDHRAKNVLAVVQGIVRLSSAETPQGYAAAVWARVSSLARAHDLLAERGWAGADLRAVAERELGAYSGSVVLEGETLPVAAGAVQPIAMVLHELATNAAKNGALSAPGGTVRLRWWAEGESLRLRWAESGGPLPAGPPARPGFGTRLIDATIRGQLGGTLERRWDPPGLSLDLTLPLARVGARGMQGAAA